MKSGLKPALALLVILGLGDLAQVPFMLAAHRQHAGEPPRGIASATPSGARR